MEGASVCGSDGSRPDRASFSSRSCSRINRILVGDKDSRGCWKREESEGAKFCQFRLNGNPRDFLCSLSSSSTSTSVSAFDDSILSLSARHGGGGCAETARVRPHIYPHAQTWKISHSLLLSVPRVGVHFVWHREVKPGVPTGLAMCPG